MNNPGFVFLAFSFFGLGAKTVDFDNVKLEMMPPYWTSTATHAGPAPRWEVESDKTAPSHQKVFAQISKAGAPFEIPLAIFDKVICRDGDLSVKFKIDAAQGGKQSGSAGMVWRYQDPGNYYLLRFSADEKNIALFRMQNGQSHAIPVLGGRPGESTVYHDIRAEQWYVAKVSYRGSHFRVLFGNRILFEGVDDSIRNQGKTGLCTKAGTVAEFDDFRIDKKS